MKLYSDKYELSNVSNQTILLWIEPWALDIEIPPNSNCILYSKSEINGKFEVENGKDQITIYGWSGAGLIVEIDGKEEWNYTDCRVPVMSNGMSTKEFVNLIFNPPQKKWWQFWN